MSRPKSQTQYSLGFLFKELIFDIWRFPLWWYSAGLKQISLFWLHQIQVRAEQLSLRIWLKNMFTPMYGDYTRSGRLISFFLRIVVLIGRSIAFVFWFIFLSIFVVLWIVLPVFLIYAIFRNLF